MCTNTDAYKYENTCTCLHIHFSCSYTHTVTNVKKLKLNRKSREVRRQDSVDEIYKARGITENKPAAFKALSSTPDSRHVGPMTISHASAARVLPTLDLCNFHRAYVRCHTVPSKSKIKVHSPVQCKLW